MSRIGKTPIAIPEGVKVNITAGRIEVSGPKGSISISLRPELETLIKENQILVKVKNKTKLTSSFFGTTRTLIQNAIIGVTKGFEKKLEIHGAGYKVYKKENDLVLELGFSHPITIKAPEGIDFQIQKNTIIISGINKIKIGEMAAQIRMLRPVEPYKGKGIRYAQEIIKKKVGKKAKAAIGEGGAGAQAGETGSK